MCPLPLEYVYSAMCCTVGKRQRTKPQRLGLGTAGSQWSSGYGWPREVLTKQRVPIDVFWVLEDNRGVTCVEERHHSWQGTLSQPNAIIMARQHGYFDWHVARCKSTVRNTCLRWPWHLMASVCWSKNWRNNACLIDVGTSQRPGVCWGSSQLLVIHKCSVDGLFLYTCYSQKLWLWARGAWISCFSHLCDQTLVKKQLDSRQSSSWPTV